MTRLPLVDIALVAYNHEKFIAQSIESVLAQKTDFEYRLIIGDDCSTDNTQMIIRNYAEKYPDRIKTILYTKHLGLMHQDRVGIAVLRMCTAKYVALLDGDDYWTDMEKLQKQINFLEKHPECSMCCHPVQIEYSGERKRHWESVYGVNENEFYSIEDILTAKKWPEIPTNGLMLRWAVLPEIPEWLGDVLRADTVLQLLFAHYGKIGFLKESMGVHRKYGGGVTTLFDTDPDYMQYDILKVFIYIDQHFDYQYQPLLKRHIEGVVQYFLKNSKKSREKIESIIEFCRSDKKREKECDFISPLKQNLNNVRPK